MSEYFIKSIAFRAVLLCTVAGLFIDIAFATTDRQKKDNNDSHTVHLGSMLMPVGAYYYPEHWEANEWADDLKRMADLGFEFTHFGEFAWAMMEPEEGKFEFEWLDRVVELAQQNGLKVIMCTPTPTPPAWLTQKHPEILSVNENLYTQQHGSRLHAIYNHPVFLRYVERIVTKLGQRYGQHPAVAGWQLDNEPHFGPLYDYSEQAEIEFPVWLQERYGTIQRLNEAWGTAFWSQTYNSFDQIGLPNKNRAPQGPNPHAMLDFGRFTMDRLAEGLRFQAEVLEKHISEDQWITTNYAYFKFLPATDPFRNKHDLDFASHTMYLTSGFLHDEGGPLAFRLGSGLELAFSNEMAKSVNGYTGIMELQPGQINWGMINPQPLPGAVRMWIWHSFGLGDKFVCTYRFKQPLYGGEQTHKGIIDTDGVSLARGGEEYVQAIKEIRKLPTVAINTDIPAEVRARKTAFLWSFENMLDLENHRHHADFDPWEHMYRYYAILKSMGCPVNMITSADVIEPAVYPHLVVPAYQIVSRDLIERWLTYVQHGGNLIITSRTAKKDPAGHLWKTHNQQPIWDLIGARITEFDQLPAQYPGKVVRENAEYLWYKWGDWLEPEKGTETLAVYADQFYAGTAAAVSRVVGKGRVTYIGVHTNDGELEKKIVNQMYERSGTKVMDLPPYVFVEWRDGFWVGVNYASGPFNLPIESEVELVHGQQELYPGGVTVWYDK